MSDKLLAVSNDDSDDDDDDDDDRDDDSFDDYDYMLIISELAGGDGRRSQRLQVR